jgi:hypothetical protein
MFSLMRTHICPPVDTLHSKQSKEQQHTSIQKQNKNRKQQQQQKTYSNLQTLFPRLK